MIAGTSLSALTDKRARAVVEISDVLVGVGAKPARMIVSPDVPIISTGYPFSLPPA